MQKRTILALISILIITHLTTSTSLCAVNTNLNCLPCPSQCISCSNQSTCTTCISQYFTNSTVPSGCQACPQNCMTCTQSSCTACNNPYVLVNNTCSLCVVMNALRCSSLVVASACKSGYYLNDGSCSSCLLNCMSCSSAFDCSTCMSGYYLNSSIITCNPCPVGCSSCNQFTPSICLTCNNNYELIGTNCVILTCNIANCLYCSSATVCKQCRQFYYWNGSSCLSGASVTCQYGSNGPYPNNCINSCGQFSMQSDSFNGSFRCKLYRSVYTLLVQYSQRYYYAFNHLAQLNSLASSNIQLQTQSNGQYSLLLSNTLKILDLPNYYKMKIAVKYTANSNVSLSLSATTPSLSTQTQTTLLSSSSNPSSIMIDCSVLHSNNLHLNSSVPIGIVQIWLRMSRCASDCIICLNRQLCEYCSNGYYMLNYKCFANCSTFIHYTPNMTCLSTCPDGHHPKTNNNSLKYCQTCAQPCLTCLNQTTCLSCINGYFYYQYQCSSSCPAQYFPDSSTNICQSCITPCKTCVSSSICLSCQVGFWNGTHCANNCPNGYFGNTRINNCSICDASCLTCSQSALTCTSCLNTLILHNKQCLSNCPQRFYNSNSTCMQCIPPCYTCSSASICLTCSYNYLHNSSCLSSCLQGFYQDVANLICLSCSTQCKTCDSSILCTSCKSGCLYQGNCLSSCSAQSLSLFNQSNITSGQCSCIRCIYPCSTCLTQSYCISCIDGFHHQGYCLTLCPALYFADSVNKTCALCSSAFANCINCVSTGCSQCQSTFFLSNGKCVSSCPQLYYPHNQQCMLCQAPCRTCLSKFACLSCVSPFILLNDGCVTNCPTSQLALLVNQTLQCVSCKSPCFSCSGSIDNCTYCISGFFLFGNNCITNCSSISTSFSYYGEISSLSCKICSFPCKTCLTSTQCLSCQIGYLNQHTFTCKQCSLGTYPNLSVCQPCPVQCRICYSSTFCTSCAPNYYLFQSTCISNTSICQVNGYYTSGRVCYPCLQPCLTCWVTASNCTTCLSGYIFYPPNKCLIQCPSGYYQHSYSCLLCAPQCSTCIGSSSYCITCSSGYFLYLVNSSCLSLCPAITYESGSMCSTCQYPCETCSSQTQCLTCLTGVLVGTGCYSSCISGYFANLNMTCQPCSSPCSQCIFSSTNCTQCISSHWLYGNQCVTQCPDSYFPQSQSRQCLTCVGLCKQCNSYVNCTTCQNTHIYFFSTINSVGECLSACPASYYKDSSDTSCLKCNSSCSTCQNSTACLTCAGSLVQLNGQCITACPALMYSLAGKCQSCSFPCQNCSDASTCTSCPTNYLLVDSSSCFVGPNCPQGSYLHPTQPSCSKKCPLGYYNLPNYTCDSVSCGSQLFMGEDMFCYSVCPQGYQVNSSWFCQPCGQCSSGLYFRLSYAIIKDSLYLYLFFTQKPTYLSSPSLNLQPALPYKDINEDSFDLVGNTLNYTGSTNITFVIPVNYSLSALQLNVSFTRSLQTFSNPLQKSYSIINIQGYDYYPPDLPSMAHLGILTLVCSLIGIVKNPYMVDMGQILLLIGLLNVHYPFHFASFLQSASMAHLYGIVSIQQTSNLGEGKFMYLTGTGFLTNTLTNWIIIAAVLIVAVVIYVILFVARLNGYKKVDDENRHAQIINNNNNQSNNNNTQNNNNDHTSQEKQQLPLRVRLANFLQAILSNFKHRWVSRLAYFNYSIISLFTFAQLANFNTSTGINIVACGLAILTIPLLLYLPITFRTDKPKYSFLLIRKLLISAAVVLSLQDAIYAVGIISVCNFTAALLILTYKQQTYRAQTRFLAIGQGLQLLTFTALSFFIMIGQGNKTTMKVTLCWIVLFAILALIAYYLVFSIIQLIIYICMVAKDCNLRQNWVLNKEQNTTDSHHSQSIEGSMKDKSIKSKEQQAQIGQNLQTLLGQMKQEMKSKIEVSRMKKTGEKSRVQGQTKQEFWVYKGESQKQEQSQGQSGKVFPQMLVRCVNQFSDYDHAEKHQPQLE